jgi:hypothetical protein
MLKIDVPATASSPTWSTCHRSREIPQVAWSDPRRLD